MLREYENMKKHTSIKTGGIARYYFEPTSIYQLQNFLKTYDNKYPLIWIGLGSNLLVRDNGFDGVIIGTKKLQKINLEKPYLQVQAGVKLPKIAYIAQQEKLQGAQFFVGIPGTVGGALAMNAGAYGFEIWQFIESVTTINSSGEIFNRKKNYYDIGYRFCQQKKGQKEYFIQANFCFDKQIKEIQILELLKKRRYSQPVDKNSFGSVFRNPDSNFAAYLIEKTGLKGYSLGDASVSNKHANFIINNGNATVSNIENLINYIRDKVYKKYQISLITEVQIIGNK